MKSCRMAEEVEKRKGRWVQLAGQVDRCTNRYTAIDRRLLVCGAEAPEGGPMAKLRNWVPRLICDDQDEWVGERRVCRKLVCRQSRASRT